MRTTPTSTTLWTFAAVLTLYCNDRARAQDGYISIPSIDTLSGSSYTAPPLAEHPYDSPTIGPAPEPVFEAPPEPEYKSDNDLIKDWIIGEALDKGLFEPARDMLFELTDSSWLADTFETSFKFATGQLESIWDLPLQNVLAESVSIPASIFFDSSTTAPRSLDECNPCIWNDPKGGIPPYSGINYGNDGQYIPYNPEKPPPPPADEPGSPSGDDDDDDDDSDDGEDDPCYYYPDLCFYMMGSTSRDPIFDSFANRAAEFVASALRKL